MHDLHFSRCFGRVDGTSTALDDLDVESTRVLASRARADARTTQSGVAKAFRSRTRASQAKVSLPSRIADYEIGHVLGYGGMGVVYEARHRISGANVALKTVNAKTTDARDALAREIRALERVSHRGIVQIYQSGAWRGLPFFTMDLVPGPRLSRMSSARETSQRAAARPHRGLLTMLRRLASSLAHLHAAGVVHGDLSPRNILVRERDEPVLVDFGLATLSSPNMDFASGSRVTRAMGTLAYMAPEQIRHESIDARSDLYALGCLLYETLTGRPPFIARHRATVLQQHLEATPCPPSLFAVDLDPALDDLTLRLLAKVPARRVQHAEEVAHVLGALGGEDWPSHRASKSERRRSVERRRSLTAN